MADDTGLEVDALEGDPGVRSARYAGEDATYADNVAKLLADARRRVPADRDAPASAPSPWPAAPTAARWSPRAWSRAASPPAPAGDGGFGYDPVFVPDDGDGRTFAEMSADEKHAAQPPRPRLPALVKALGRMT